MIVLACAYANRSLIEYDIQQNEYSDWTRKHLVRMPIQWFSERSPIINLFYDTKEKLFVIDSTYLSIIERGKKMPGTYTKIFNTTNQTNSPIHVCKQFKYLLHVTLLSPTQLFVVELIPSDCGTVFTTSIETKTFWHLVKTLFFLCFVSVVLFYLSFFLKYIEMPVLFFSLLF